ncbi:type I restriction endonuclease [Flagellimonas amoyensis]|uniref:type I restriction endonuclease n=1 Tax=Flagellimonas amoyensis TaxID=2169401 RepID=UPI0028BF1CA7|nr:type I restriction endonuclease [Allomuricauda amoyensis]
MELQNQLKTLAEKVVNLKGQIDTEESTKHAFVLPFINLLGYDTFNPTEVVPEFTADLGLKKGEKVDYAIFQNGEPIIIVECKNWKEKLNPHNSQLFRYFHTTKTRFALLTNGIEYQFYADLEAVNKMDEKPFLEFDITQLKENVINEIGKFHKSNFNVDEIVDNASSLKYTKELKKMISEELQTPSYNFVRLFASRVYTGRLTEKVMGEFTDLVSKAFAQTIGEKVNDRLNAALDKESEKQQEEHKEPEKISKVTTSEEEMDGYRIVVAILRRKLPVNRIVHRDNAILFWYLVG